MVNLTPVPLNLLDYLPIIPTTKEYVPIQTTTTEKALDDFLLLCNQIPIKDLSEIIITDQKPSTNDHVYYIHSNKSKQWITNLIRYRSRLDEITQGVLSYVTWDSVALLGGLHNILLDEKLSIADFPECDVDLFVWGKDKEDCRLKTIKVLMEINQAYPDRTLFYSRGSVITIIVRNIPAAFQVICSCQSSIMDIFNTFTETMSCIGWDGSNLVCHPEYLQGVVLNVCSFRFQETKLCRISKMLNRGFTVQLKIDSTIVGERLYFPGELQYLTVEEFQALIKDDQSINYAANKYLRITEESISRITFMVQTTFGRSYRLLKNLTEYSGGDDWKHDYSFIQKGTLPQNYVINIRGREIVRRENISLDYNKITNGPSCKNIEMLLPEVTVIGAWRENNRLGISLELPQDLCPWIKNLANLCDSELDAYYCTTYNDAKCDLCAHMRCPTECPADHFYIRIRSGYDGNFPPIYYKNTKLSTVEDVCEMFRLGYKRKAKIVVAPFLINGNILSWRLLSMQLYQAFFK